jgi:hypothetical protein
MEYKQKYWEKRSPLNLEFKSLNNIINENIELSNILSEYLPNIYFINTRSLEPGVLPYLIIKNNQKEKSINIIMTNNIIDFQLANLDRTSIITLKSDNSEFFKKKGLIKSLLNNSKKKNSSTLSSNFYIPVISMSGHEPYNLSGIKGIGKIKAINQLEKALENKIIVDTKFQTMIPILKALNYNQSDIDLIENNFKSLSYDNLALQVTPKQFDNIKSQIENKSDNESLMEINNKYYKKYPIMLIELYEGELY